MRKPRVNRKPPQSKTPPLGQIGKRIRAAQKEMRKLGNRKSR